jgi:hypothetical protein
MYSNMNNCAVRSRALSHAARLCVLAAMTAGVSGCGGSLDSLLGDLGFSGDANKPAASNTPPSDTGGGTTGGDTGGTGGTTGGTGGGTTPPTPTADQGNSFYVMIPNAKALSFLSANKSPNAGQNTAVTETGGPSFASASTAAVTGPPGPALAASGALANECTGAPCDVDHYYSSEIVTQGGVTVTKETVVDGDVTVSQKFLTVRTAVGQQAVLQYSYYGEYGEANLTGTVTNADQPEPTLTETGGSATIGYYHGGTETTNMPTGAVTATYNGRFAGTAAQSGSNALANGMADINGDVTMLASFGGATITGNVYNLQRSPGDDCDPCDSTPVGYGLRMDGAIVGSQYAGSTAFTTGAIDAAASGTARGEMLGGFYGDGAAETTGVARIQGATPTGTPAGPGVGDNVYLSGSFGAVKAPPPPAP